MRKDLKIDALVKEVGRLERGVDDGNVDREPQSARNEAGLG